jgi:hypothetical protein
VENKVLKGDIHPRDMLTPNKSTTWPAVLAESSTSFNASSSLQVTAKPSSTVSKLARGYRDFKMPELDLPTADDLSRLGR